MIIHKKETRTPKKPRTANLGYQKYQDAQALAMMRNNLSSDGLFTASSQALGNALGASQQTASRVIARLISQKKVHLVSAATDRFGRPVPDALGRQVTNKIFPWRHPYSSVSTGKPSINTGDSSTPWAQTAAPYSSVSTSTCNSSTDNQLSAGYKSLVVRTVDTYPSVSTAPPAWAVSRQLSLAKERLKHLEQAQAMRLKKLEGRDWTTPVELAEHDLKELKAYIADLSAWSEERTS